MNEKTVEQVRPAAVMTEAGGGKKELYTINDAAARLGVHQQTLRNWERKKLIIPLRVGARRIYTAGHMELCVRIKEFSGKGVSLRGIKEILKKI